MALPDFVLLITGKLKDDFLRLNTHFAAIKSEVNAIVLGSADAEVGQAHVSTAKGESFTTLDDRIEDIETDLLAAESDVSSLQSLKADTTYVDTQIAAVASGSPSGVYATLVALEAAYPTGTTGIYVVTADGHWYYWSGAAWADGGAYQATEIADGTVTPVKTNFLTTGTNKINPDTLQHFKSINITTGAVETSVGENMVTDNIYTGDYGYLVMSYLSSGGTQSLITAVGVAQYEADDTFISYAADDITTLNASCAYVKLYIPVGYLARVAYVMCELASSLPSTFSTYEAYKILFLHNDDVERIDSVLGENILDNSTPTGKVSYIDIGKNKFNPHTCLHYYYINTTTGVITATANENLVSDKIYVGTTDKIILSYVASNGTQALQSLGIAQYDSAGAFISYSTASSATFAANCYYVRLYILASFLARVKYIQAELVASAVTDFTTYAPYMAVISRPAIIKPAEISLLSELFTGIGQVKLIGDSITAGVNGTNYKNDGTDGGQFLFEVYGNDYYENLNGTCWANMLRDYIEEKFPACTVKNWGTHGLSADIFVTVFTEAGSLHGVPDLIGDRTVLDFLIEDDDDLVICMIGTNDRDDSLSLTGFKDNLQAVVDYIVTKKGKKLILVSSIPASVANEEDVLSGSGGTYFHMEDVDMVVSQVATENSLTHISLYRAMVEYVSLTGYAFDTHLDTAGLHPDDDMYGVMFDLICREIGLATKRSGATW